MLLFASPTCFRRLFAEGAFSQAFVPVLTGQQAQHGERDQALIDRVASLLTWALMLTCVVVWQQRRFWSWPWPAAWKQDPRVLSWVFMTRWMFLHIGFMSLVAQVRVSSTPGVDLPFRCDAGSAQSGDDFAAWLGPASNPRASSRCTHWRWVVVGGVLQLAVQVPALSDWVCCPISALGLASMRGAASDPAARNIAKLMVPAIGRQCGANFSVDQHPESPPTSRRAA
jgi:putative peptidoglycan lipid II flippase